MNHRVIVEGGGNVPAPQPRRGRAALCDSGGMDTETIAARKRELRRELRARRAHRYAGEEGAALRAEQAQRILVHAEPLIAQVERAAGAAAAAGDGARPLVAAFHPTPTEADVLPLVRRLVRAGARLVFPAAAGTELDWILWDGRSPFADSPGRGFGREPAGRRLGPDALADASLVLAPAVAVDRSLTRIGHGAGYYDRALSTVPDRARVVAVVHPDELLPAGALPRGEHDVPIPEVLTADGLVSLVTSTSR